MEELTTSTEGPLADLPPPSKPRLLRNRFIPMFFLRLGPNVSNAVLLIDASSTLLIVYCNPERFPFWN